MPRRFALASGLAIAIALALGNDAEAYKPSTHIDLDIRFENLEAFPGWTFYLKFRRSASANQPESVQAIELKPGAATRITAQHVSDTYILAMPRGQKIELPEAVNDEWLRHVPAGGLQTAPLTTIPKGKKFPGHPGDLRRRKSEIVYRVRIEGAAMDATCVAWNGSDTEPYFTPDKIMMLIQCAPVAAVVLVLTLILYLVSRRAEAARAGPNHKSGQ